MYRRPYPLMTFGKGVGTSPDPLGSLKDKAEALPQQSAAPPQFQPYEVRPLISMPLPKMSSMMPMKPAPIGIRFD
jgi:hypothetical protein